MDESGMRIRFIEFVVAVVLFVIRIYFCCWLYDALPYFVDDLFSGVILCKFLMFRRLDASGRTGYLDINIYTRICTELYLHLFRHAKMKNDKF